MKKLSRINFNHATKEIIITKAFETEANVIGSAAYDELVRIRKATYVHYILNGEEKQTNAVYLLEPFETDIVVDGVTYNFYGWSEDEGGTLLVEITRNHYHLYAVYKNAETGAIMPITSILL